MTLQSGRGGADQSGGTPTARRMVLGAQLRRMREEAGISRADAGFHIRGSESKISRMELGRVGFKDRDVADLMTLYGRSDPEEREEYLQMVRDSNTPGWWYRYHDLLPAWFTNYVGLEESASRIQTFELQFVPGLLQTEDYARAVATKGRPEYHADATERRIALRMRRQKILSKPNAPRLWAFIDEAVLHRPVGGPAVLKDQLDALIEWTKMPHIAVQVLPYSRSNHGAEGAFSVLRFAEPELPDIVYVEYLTGAVYLDKQDDLEPYARAIDQLAVDAETPDQSRALLEKRRNEI
ncbi:helix-turn-helix domain-containing protein [Haloechinothrix halophila]|uniref:helix-turn-helix domain-containing protein n=1 Tax=Haloechinothrix halophila TaxID=1069073 RepID=UPI0004256A3B|nr:helix-turn-helix transcriptional regulator [Haloechinothrix halophila]